MLNVEMTLILGMEIDADCVLVDIHLPGWMLTGDFPFCPGAEN